MTYRGSSIKLSKWISEIVFKQAFCLVGVFLWEQLLESCFARNQSDDIPGEDEKQTSS